MLHTPAEPGIGVPGPFLHGIRLSVQGQDQNVHGNAQGDDGDAGAVGDVIAHGENDLKHQLQRADDQGLEKFKKGHAQLTSFPEVISSYFRSR